MFRSVPLTPSVSKEVSECRFTQAFAYTYSADWAVLSLKFDARSLARRAAEGSPRREPWGDFQQTPQPGGRHIEGRRRWIEVSPSGLRQTEQTSDIHDQVRAVGRTAC